jgi:uncharacterized protein YjbI with pentapeptide repeats
MRITHRSGATLFESDDPDMKTTMEKAVERNANLRNANLRNANLHGALLSDTNLTGATVNWQSRALIAELLSREAGEDTEKLKIAGLVLLKVDWCWKEFLAAEDPLKGWAIASLKKYVTKGKDAPDILTQ